MGQEVPAIETPVTETQAVSILTELLPVMLGFTGNDKLPPEPVAIYTLALAWVETNHGRSVIQNNAGNVSCRDDGSVDFWRPPWFSGDNPKYAELHERMLRGQAPRAFRAYDTALLGWADFLREVVRRKPLLAAMAANDAGAVVQALHDTNYSKDYGAQHVPTFESLARDFRARGYFADWQKVNAPGVRKSGVSVLVLLELLALASVAYYVATIPRRKKMRA